ncbi:MAG: hypothetical protein LBC90_03825 [Candidatus Adiutrix sp.]|jgi:hypothetical protein|nr:hypothetical protein [Candidatus Adiutrix sp.]
MKELLAGIAGNLADIDSVLLVDYENVKPDHQELARLREMGRFYLVFIVPESVGLKANLVNEIQKFGSSASYCLLRQAGHNNLDFHLVFILGYFLARQPDLKCYILSQDTDYDHVIRSWNEDKNEQLWKVRKISDIPGWKWEKGESSEDMVSIENGKVNDLVVFLKKLNGNRPASVNTLTSTAMRILSLPEEKASEVLRLMRAKKLISVTENSRISYSALLQ